jgi:hypothetical protein
MDGDGYTTSVNSFIMVEKSDELDDSFANFTDE